ncbi:hypothetical protein [Telmatospirillum sp. J64-1]|uniref:hypothetical protein n=1 Tax=Telmatospirillum sp. J64-1 TaxID=2502183 RepID=UPI00115DAEFC|nr:hypothetical protein [Telmatospirillum sp. J64-1]
MSVFSRSFLAATAAICAALAAGACSQSRLDRTQFSHLPQSHSLSALPVAAEARAEGPAALSSALAWAGRPVPPAKLARQMGKGGPGLADAAQRVVSRHGRVAYPVRGLEALFRELAAGHPVVALLEEGSSFGGDWNALLVTGYDLPKGEVLVQHSDGAVQRRSLAAFQQEWERHGSRGLLVLPPGEPPATATEQDYAKAVQSLAEVGHAWDAVLAYDTLLALWPENAGAQSALVSRLEVLGDLKSGAGGWDEVMRTGAEGREAASGTARRLAEVKGRSDI